MTTFKEQMQLDLDVFFDTSEFATSVVYTPASGGDAVTVPAIVDYGATGRMDEGKESDGYVWRLMCAKGVRPDFDRGRVRETALVKVRKDQIPAPGYRDTFTIDGEVWTVTDIWER
ncbi:head-tail joining protein [Desulfotignum phosphitoxidans]|uniref:Uncharacterized protein n=1 Tax=Desulfotignum phosphitoxidans DSM 13687 TaxID=1286635 RepID=S0G4G0_9BACT|nr:hypothetical protein [Desulfotignum phosphitoxidans]EMS79207.1 hypothetical protein Dpo_5c01300 [Desulfotignum phosphitoxidans DSM 13687]